MNSKELFVKLDFYKQIRYVPNDSDNQFTPFISISESNSINSSFNHQLESSYYSNKNKTTTLTNINHLNYNSLSSSSNSVNNTFNIELSNNQNSKKNLSITELNKLKSDLLSPINKENNTISHSNILYKKKIFNKYTKINSIKGFNIGNRIISKKIKKKTFSLQNKEINDTKNIYNKYYSSINKINIIHNNNYLNDKKLNKCYLKKNNNNLSFYIKKKENKNNIHKTNNKQGNKLFLLYKKKIFNKKSSFSKLEK